VTRFLHQVPESSVDRLQCGDVFIEVGAGVVYHEWDDCSSMGHPEHILFVTDIVIHGMVGWDNVRRARPQVVGYRLDYLEKSSAQMKEYTEKHPLRTKPHMVAQTGKKRSIEADQVQHRIVVVPEGFWEDQFTASPEYVLVAGDAGSGKYVATEETILSPLDSTCESFIAWATRTEFRLQQPWVDTVLAVVRHRVQLYLCNRASKYKVGCINAIALDNIAPSFVYQVCLALFVLDSVFWLSLSNCLCAVSGLQRGHGCLAEQQFVLELSRRYTHALGGGKDFRLHGTAGERLQRNPVSMRERCLAGGARRHSRQGDYFEVDA
jgi:hypothetical protein